MKVGKMWTKKKKLEADEGDGLRLEGGGPGSGRHKSGENVLTNKDREKLFRNTKMGGYTKFVNKTGYDPLKRKGGK
jgi:hypothetical protein